LANLLQGSRSTFSCVCFPRFFAFQAGMWDAPISALLNSPTVSGRFVRLGGRAKKLLLKWLIRFVTGTPRGTTLAIVGSKADCTHIALWCMLGARPAGLGSSWCWRSPPEDTMATGVLVLMGMAQTVALTTTRRTQRLRSAGLRHPCEQMCSPLALKRPLRLLKRHGATV
jgi:hypothetical protein